MMIFDPKTLRK